MPNEFTSEERIAYFSMEIAIRSQIPTYSGGLGVLAGDIVRTAADLAVPLVTVTLTSRAGYFRQHIDEAGRQIEEPDPWDPASWAEPLEARVAVPIEGHHVWVGGWLLALEGHLGGRQPIILLDTDINENRPEERELTHYLYGGDQAYRLKQEIILGIGGVRMLQALGFRVWQYHMNEGHSALLCLELLNRYAYPPDDVRTGESPYDIPRVREQCNFTTHTPVEAAQDQFPYDLVQQVLGNFVELATLKHLAGDQYLNMTRLALNASEYVNGVAERHAEISRRLYPGYRVQAITNGVHPLTWTYPAFARLYDAHLPGWRHEPELLVRADCCIDDEAVWQAHLQAKTSLVEIVRVRTGISLDPAFCTLGFARRMTSYKRPELLFTDLERLTAIARQHRFQVVLAGKAHPRDQAGKDLIESLHAHIRSLAQEIPIVFLPNYDTELAAAMVSGSDVWLNTPLPPWEASGTSGMKATFNGVPNLSVPDGWWAEGLIEGVTGWSIGDGVHGIADAGLLYDKLEQTVLPLYDGDRSGWIAVMKGAIAKNASFFTSHRMLRRYVSDVYVR